MILSALDSSVAGGTAAMEVISRVLTSPGLELAIDVDLEFTFEGAGVCDGGELFREIECECGARGFG